MDAGAGTGILQWYLAEQGAEVLSVDRGSRGDLPLRFRRRFNVQGLRPQDLAPASTGSAPARAGQPGGFAGAGDATWLGLPGTCPRERPRDRSTTRTWQTWQISPTTRWMPW